MFIRRDFELRVQPSRKNGTRDGGKEIKYLPGEQERSRNSKAPGAISNAYLPPLPLPLPSLVAYSFTRVIDLRLVLLPRRSTVHFYTVDASLTKFPAT